MEIRGEATTDVHLSGDKGIEDMIKMNTLDEESILKNLKIRYLNNLIYTNTGSILVSLNPYKRLPIYAQEVVREYIGTSSASMGTSPAPHIFATAEACYHDMRDRHRNQSVIISGESGAGKTEATKLILQFLAARTTKHSAVEQKILESSPILEAFGNAKTVRNDNSSRFGKFIEIHFEGSGQICGAKISNYLLERAQSERNYHIFYQFLAGADKEEKERYQLLDIEQYNYLNQSGCTSVPTINDVEDYNRVRQALLAMDMSTEVQDHLFTILSGIMRLGNIQFEGAEVSKVSNPQELAIVGQLLKISPEGLGRALTTRTLVVSGQKIQVNFKAAQAADARDALAKAIYSKLFDWIVVTINKVIHKPKPVKSFIGVLDIFGFENFNVNSFEQFCINYANEKLQQYFNETIFKIEQTEYSTEAIKWDNIDFNDNQDTIDLIEKTRPPGIISLLDEECRFPKATDTTFLEKIDNGYKTHKKFYRPKKSRTAFVIKHYAGEVAYETANFLEKNRDTLAEDLVALLNDSKLPLVKALFPLSVADTQSSGRQAKSPTVGTNFKAQLAELMATLGATAPHYVRCIKPNTMKAPAMFDDDMVLAQLRYAGMMETIRIRRLGYPVRYPVKEFMYRYRMLLPLGYANDPKNKDKSGQLDLFAVAKNILSKVPCPSDDGSLQWQLGKSKVFMKEAQSAAVENTRNKAIWAKVVTIQSWWRMVWTRNYFAEMRQAAKLIQTVVRGFIQRRRYAVLIAADRKRREEARKKSEEESRRREEERLAKEEARRSEEEKERLMEKESKDEQSVPALSVTQPRVHSVLYDEKPMVSMYKTSSPLVTVSAADDAAPGSLSADSAWRDQKEALDAKSKAVDPAAASLRRRLTSKRDATIKRHTPMLRKGDSTDQYPDVIGRDEASKYDIMEYAQTHFNFERLKKRTIRTLGRKKGDFSISEILCYSKKLEQPLHTTQNANFIKFAVKFFKLITRFVDGEAHFDVLKEVFLAGISNGGSLRAFRNELYCQAIKQTMKNPSKDSTMRSWELLSAFCGVFYPTDDFVPYLASYLMQNFVNPSEIGQYAQYAYGKLKEMSFHFANKLSRLYPPSRLELEANRERKLIPVWFHVPGGMSTCVMSSAGATAADAFTPLTSKNLKLADPMEFAIFEIYPHLNLGRSLSPSDFLADMLSKAEKYGHESLFWFKKKLWLDPTTLPEDPVEARLETLQIHADIVSGKFPCPHEQALVLSGIRFLIDEIQDAQSTKVLNFCERYVPQALIPQKPAAEWTRIIHEEAEKIRGFELNESGLVNLFLKKAQKLSLYGKSLFQVHMATTDIDIPDSFMLAIDVNGIEIRDKDSGDLLRQFAYPDLGPVTYDAGSTVVNFHERMQRRPLHIKTPLGVEICSLCEDYLYWLREDSGTAVALQDYVVTDKNLLSFTKGQKIELLSREGNWWRGKLNGKTGSFPASMVEILIATTNTNLVAGKLRKRLSERMSTRDLAAMKLTDSGTERSRAGSRRESRVGGVAEPLEMRNVPRKSSRTYYRKMSESSGQHSLALPAMSDRNSARLSRRYEMTEFAQSNFKAVAPTSSGGLKNSRTDLLSNSLGTLRRGMMGSRSKLTTEPPAPSALTPSASTSTPELSVPSVTFTDVPIREPLTKNLPEEFAKEATKIFTMVMKYMGDYPSKKGLDSFKLMQKICQRGIDNPKLRDELYCQLIKQVSGNPKSGNTIRGWELLAISCGLFVPSRALGPYLVDFLTEHIKADEKQLPKAQQDIQRLAQAALRRLDRIRAVGMRAHAPSFVEYDAVRCAEQVPCTVWTFDGESHVVRVDMAATVKDVMTHVIESIGLSPAAVAARDWALCAIRGNPDDAKHRFGLETGEKLAEKDHVCDVVAVWEKEEKVKGPVQLLFQEWLTLDQTSPVDDPAAIHLLAHQAVSRIVSGRYPVTEGEAPYLTALQFYFDKLKGKVDEPITERSLYISLFYLPINLKSRRSDEEWLSAIFNEWNGLDHTMTMTQAESLYLETAQRWKFFGGNVFYAESKQFPKANALAVHRDGLAVLRLPEKEPLAFAPFRAIFNWSSTQNSVGVVVGSLMNPHRYVFSTSQAPSMVQTFVCYMEKLVAETRQQEESKAQGFSQATLRDMRTRRPF